MEMDISKCMKESEDEQTPRKRKRKKVDWFVFLPDDILLDILKRVPDVFLRYKAKHVCKRWFDIISNRILLDHVSYILQKMRTRLVDIREEGQGLQVKEQDLDIPHRGMIRSWCNKFLLISGPNRNSLYVYNLITNEGSYLPECNASCGGYCSNKCGVALSFDRFTGIYKVVHLFIGRTIECHIFIWRKGIITRAVSNWKKIQVPYMNEGVQYIWGEPVSVEGRYLNWRIHYSNEMVSVDMVKEEICIISLPGSSDCGKYYCSLFMMGGCLGLFDGVSMGKAEIWVLKDFHRVTWEKLKLINDSSRYFDKYPGKVINYRICGMLSKRYAILKSSGGMYSYDLKSEIMKKLDIHIQYTPFQPDDEPCVVHSTGTKFKIVHAKNH